MTFSGEMSMAEWVSPGQPATLCTPTVVQCPLDDHGDTYVASDDLNETGLCQGTIIMQKCCKLLIIHIALMVSLPHSWKYNGSPSPKTSWMGKWTTTFFWYKTGILMVELLPQAIPVSSIYCSILVHFLWEILHWGEWPWKVLI